MTIIALIFLLVLMLVLKSQVFLPFSLPEQSTSIALGFILIFAYLFGKKISDIKLPQITGFILAGILCGPYVLKILQVNDVENLQLLDGLALSLIALTAGGEMHVKQLKKSFKTISSIVLFQTFIIIFGFVLLGILGLRFFPIFADYSFPYILAFSLLLGTLATATSPSTTIAVMTEMRSKGKYTELVLSSAVVKDFFVIGLFAFALSITQLLVSPTQGFDAHFLGEIFKEIGGSVALGVLIGGGIILYLKYVKRELAIFILGVAFFTYQISHNYGFHPLMICLVAGFIVQNFSAQGEQLITALERVSMPVYVVFFAISGASIDLNALGASWMLALVCVIWRAFMIHAGTFSAVALVKEELRFRKHGWMGFVSQAGVALGMAIIIEDTFPEWGAMFKTLVLAVIALNQIIGPILLQKFLILSGETGKKF